MLVVFFLLKDGVLGVKETLGRADGDVDDDPILGRRVVRFIDAIGQKQFMEEVEALLRWSD